MWVRQDKQTVLRRLAEGAAIQTIVPQASGALDELVALSTELETFRMLDAVKVSRERQGIPDALLLQTLAVLPFLADGSLQGSAQSLFSDPAILVQLGYAPVELATGVSARHRQSRGKTAESIPLHIDTLRDELARLSAADWEQVQEERLRVLYAKRLIRSTKVVVDGSGLGEGERVVTLSALTGHGVIPLAWEFLTGDASEKGKEATITRKLVERVRKVAGSSAISLLIADAFYADGPFLAWLEASGTDGLVRLPEDRLLFAEGLQVIALEGDSWQRRRQTRTLDGHKETRTVEVAVAHGLTEWDSYQTKAKELGIADPTLSVSFIRQLEPTLPPEKTVLALVSTKEWSAAWQTYEAYRPRWWIENAGFNELKEGWLVERYPWGRSEAIVRGRVGFTLLAQQVVALYCQAAGRQLVGYGIRRLRRALNLALGGPGMVVVVDAYYAVLHAEELLEALGHPVAQSLRRALTLPTARRRA
ncbi:MAG: transposase [Chloroflexota bacterium]